LRGEKPANIPHQLLQVSAPMYDWRELQRWGISEARLPAGSIVQFRKPSLWHEYKWHLMGTVSFIVAQTLLIAALLRQASRRRESEEQMTMAANAAQLGIWAWDIRMDRVWMSRNCKQLLGLNNGAEMTHETFRSRVHPQDRQARDEALQAAMDGSGQYETQY